MSPSLPPDARLGRYEIRSQLGAGGMGEVYLALDTKLDRKVALKILPAEVAANQKRMRRFVQEAKSASALNHPNIITIYEIEQIDSVNFIATEFIDGETLRQRMKRAPMKLSEVLDAAVQIGSALSAAHAAGIVHRDIKPENIMIRHDGIVKVLDFGLAKLTERLPPESVDTEAATSFKTDPGTVVGTAIYMSPEQARGMPVDARTDTFSLGIVLYEMVAGRLPFEGSTSCEVLAAILSEKEPQPLARYSRAVPAELERIVSKTLRKDREERYQTAKDMLLDLRRLKQKCEVDAEIERTVPPELRGATGEAKPSGGQQAVSTAQAGSAQTVTVESAPTTLGAISTEIKSHKRGVAVILAAIMLFSVAGIVYYFYFTRGESRTVIESIAVLPFQNKSSDADTEYLSDGLAESLIYRLSHLPNLKVSPTSSVFRYKGKETDPIKIGNELGVNAVMTGRISQRGDNLTISVELVDVRNNKLIWGEQYERKISELLATQREIAAEIANKLQLKLSGNEKGLTKRYTDNNEAYQLYLKGRYHSAKRTKDDMFKGIEYYEQTIKLDPNFALAYARIAEAYVSMPAYSYLSPKEAMPQAKTAAKRALEIDPTLAEGHTFLAYSLVVYDWNWAEAEREFKRAIELDPNSSAPHLRYGHVYLAPLGRSDEAIAEVKRALEIEPLDLNIGANLAWAYMFARRNDLALDQAKKTNELEPNFVLGRYVLGQVFIVNGMYTEAIALSESTLQADPTSQFSLQSAGYADAKSGRRREAERVINRLKEIAKTQYVMSYWAASIYAELGDKDKAFAELDKAFAEHDWYLHRLKVDPLVDSLRDDPRFKEMLRRLNLPE